jgi:hypothetical protein
MQNISFEDVVVSTRYYNQTWWGEAEPIYVAATPRSSGTKARAFTKLLASSAWACERCVLRVLCTAWDSWQSEARKQHLIILALPQPHCSLHRHN